MNENPIGPNLSLEMSVIGALVATEETRAETLMKLRRDYFTSADLQSLFDACFEMVADGQNLDLVTLLAHLNARGKGNLIEIAAKCVHEVPNLAGGPSYADDLCKLAYRRRMYVTLSKTASEIVSGQLPNVTSSDILDRITKASMSSESERLLIPMSELIESFDVNAHELKDGVSRDPQVGILAFDRAVSIFKPSAFSVIAARPSVGKSTLMRQAAMEAAKRGPVVIFSLEESNEVVRDKMICTIAKVEYAKWYQGHSTPEERQQLLIATAELASLPITVYCGYSCDAARVKLSIRSMIEKGKKPVAVFVDHLQLMKHPKGESRDQAVGDTTRELRLGSLEFGVPIVLLCQMNRAIDQRGNEDKRPRLSDLRESGNIEANAVNVVFLWRASSALEDVNCVTATVAKHRDGPTSEFELVLLRTTGVFGQKIFGRPA